MRLEEICNEIGKLDKWFTYYDNQINQYNRGLRLGINYDKDIKALDEKAVINQKRISELRALLIKDYGISLEDIE